MTPLERTIHEKVGLWAPTWIQEERERLAAHIAHTGQPFSEEVDALWLTRRANNKCPISDECGAPGKGGVFCKVHRGE